MYRWMSVSVTRTTLCTSWMVKDIFIVLETAVSFPKLHYVIIARASECVHSGVKKELFSPSLLQQGSTARSPESMQHKLSLSHTHTTKSTFNTGAPPHLRLQAKPMLCWNCSSSLIPHRDHIKTCFSLNWTVSWHTKGWSEIKWEIINIHVYKMPQLCFCVRYSKLILHTLFNRIDAVSRHIMQSMKLSDGI